MAGQVANLRLSHIAERKQRVAELILSETKQKIGLILGGIRWTLKQPASGLVIELNSGVVAGGQRVRANLLRHDQQLIKLQMVVAQAARNGCAPRQILLD